MPVLISLTPTLINVFVIYAIANLHDVSWGNRPSSFEDITLEQRVRIENFEIFRSKFLIAWLCYNVGFAYVFIYMSRNTQHNYIFVLAYFIAVVLVIRFVMAGLNTLVVWGVKCKLNRYIARQKLIGEELFRESQNLRIVEDSNQQQPV